MTLEGGKSIIILLQVSNSFSSDSVWTNILTDKFDFIMKVNFCRFCVDIYVDLGGGCVVVMLVYPWLLLVFPGLRGGCVLEDEMMALVTCWGLGLRSSTLL